MTDPYLLKLDFPGRNALSPAVLDHLEAGLAAAAGAPLLLAGTDKAFCAGVDLRHLVGLDGPQLEGYLERLDRVAERLYEYPAPTAAVVQGHAIAGGCVLVQACDWRVAQVGSKARVGVSELALGAAFPPRILRLMEQRLPARQHVRVILGAELFDVAGALEVGLLDELAEDPEASARAFLARLAGYPAGAFAASKAGLRRGRLTPTEEDQRRLRQDELPLWAGPELRAAVARLLGELAVDLLGLEVRGISVGGVETCLEVPAWKLAFDLGSCPRSAVHLSTVLVTHAHVDHLGGVATHCATRELWGLPPARYVVPPAVAPKLERLLAVWRELDGSSFAPEVVPLAPEETLDLGKGRRVTAFRTVHRVVSQAYVVSQVRRRLRPELQGLEQEEIRARRLAGEVVSMEEAVDELAFSGDTRLEGLLQHERIRRCRRLLMEVTFLDERVSVAQCREMGHIHLDEVVEQASAFENELVCFTHRSARFSPAEAIALMDERLPAQLRQRVVAFDRQNP